MPFQFQDAGLFNQTAKLAGRIDAGDCRAALWCNPGSRIERQVARLKSCQNGFRANSHERQFSRAAVQLAAVEPGPKCSLVDARRSLSGNVLACLLDKV